MTSNGTSTTPSLPSLASAGLPCLWLSVVVLAVLPVMAGYGYSAYGRMGVYAALAAAGICWLGAVIALVVTALTRGAQSGGYGLLLGIAFRTGIPLVASMMLKEQGGPLAEAGVFGMIVVYYLITLTSETLLAMRLIQPNPAPPKASEAP